MSMYREKEHSTEYSGHDSSADGRRGSRSALRLVICLGVLVIVLLAGPVLIPLNTSSSAIMNTHFRPVEDTFVKNTRPDKNYGQVATLEADAEPSVKRFLVRFFVAGIPGNASITGATLSLHTVDSSEMGGEVRGVGGSWSETTATWNNAPQVGTKIGNVSGPAFEGTWTKADVKAAVSGNGEVNFYVTTSSANGVDYVSSEGGVYAPVLTVQWTLPSFSPLPTATPSPQPTPTSSATPPPTATPGSTPTPTPGGVTDPNFQPSAPIQAAFMYPWFPNAWNQGGIQPFSHYTPTYGYYSSTDDAIIDQQLQLASRAHLEAFISSWWGQGHHTDLAFKHILGRSERAGSPAPNMRWSLYYEPEGYGNPTVDQIVNDLNYMKTNYFGHPGFLKINGKPVIFVWAEGSDSCAMADRWEQAAAQFGNVHVALKLFSGYLSCASQPDSWHQYGPASAISQHLPNSVNVSPGFWHIKEATARLERDPARFEADIQRMVATNALWHLVTSWNEWGEGTGIEPTTQFGNIYIDILCRNLPGATPCSGGSPAATPTPAPTPGPTPVPTPALTPPPSSGGSQVLVGAGDIASCSSSGDEAVASLLDGIAGTVFTAGDNAYESGSMSEYTSCYEPSWGRHKARTKPAPGNHEYLTTAAAGYCSYFGAVANCPTGYYAYNIGAWRVYMLNSSNVNKSTELAWLQSDLAANPRQCSLAIYHHPTYTAGPHANDEGSMLSIWRAFYDAGGDLVVNGHDHSYQRYAPLNRDSNAPATGGMREIVVGTGGKGITTQDRVPAGLESAMDGNTNTAFGVLKLTLNDGSYGWQFVPVAGKTFTDSGSQACR